MTWWQALILGLVQGASEFLPISSSGHLLLLEKLGLGTQSLLFNVTAHVGTLLAVLIVMFKSWWPLARHPFQKKTGLLLMACLPTVALGLIFKLLLPSLLGGRLLGFGFVLTACILFASEKLKSAKTTCLSVKNALLCGVFQGIAVLPGVSRSGATIGALTLAGVPKSQAAEFSFLLSIPIIAGSFLLEGGQLVIAHAAADVGALPLVIGAVAAFLSGAVALKAFIKIVADRSLLGFAAYTLLLGIVVTALPLFGIAV